MQKPPTKFVDKKWFFVGQNKIGLNSGIPYTLHTSRYLDFLASTVKKKADILTVGLSTVIKPH